MNEKDFEKQQLEQLLNDLKDIDKYTSFKNGAFIYDLGKYQGSLLVNHINNLQSKIDKAIEILDKLETQPAYLDCKYYELGGFDELRNVLKEDTQCQN